MRAHHRLTLFLVLATLLNLAFFTSVTAQSPSILISIDDVSVIEGNSGTTAVQMTLTSTAAVPVDTVITLALGDGSAMVGSDYANHASIGFIWATTNLSSMFSVDDLVYGDTAYEPDETFTATITSIDNPLVGIADGEATITILNDDPGISIDDVSVIEGNSGTTAVQMTLTSPVAVPSGTVITLALGDGSATFGSDYADSGYGLLWSLSNATSSTFLVEMVYGDTVYEPDETFTATITGIDNPLVGIADGEATITILNDDPAPPHMVSIIRLNASPVVDNPVYWIIVFSEPVSDVFANDFALITTGSAVGTVGTFGSAGNGTHYSYELYALGGDGTFSLNFIDDDSVTNGSGVPIGGVGVGNGNFTGETYTIGTGDPTATVTSTSTETSTATATSTATSTGTSTPTATSTSTETSTVTVTSTSTATSTGTATATETGTSTPTATSTETLTALPTFTPTWLPPPPATPLCEDHNFDAGGVVRSSITDALRYAINCRILYQNGQPTQWLGGDLYNAGSIGIEGLLDLGVEQAVDIFSPSGMTYFNGGAVFCLRGHGTLIWLAASGAPRHAEIIGSYTVPEFDDFICATLFEPGTLVLVAHDPQ